MSVSQHDFQRSTIRRFGRMVEREVDSWTRVARNEEIARKRWIVLRKPLFTTPIENTHLYTLSSISAQRYSFPHRFSRRAKRPILNDTLARDHVRQSTDTTQDSTSDCSRTHDSSRTTSLLGAATRGAEPSRICTNRFFALMLATSSAHYGPDCSPCSNSSRLLPLFTHSAASFEIERREEDRFGGIVTIGATVESIGLDMSRRERRIVKKLWFTLVVDTRSKFSRRVVEYVRSVEVSCFDHVHGFYRFSEFFDFLILHVNTCYFFRFSIHESIEVCRNS